MINRYIKYEVVFYRSKNGNEPVRDWLTSLTESDKKAIGSDILKVQYCWPIGRPLVDNLGNGLWEVRSKLKNSIARVIFCISDNKIVLLHGFIKKTQKTPHQELELARKRKNETEK